MPLGGERLFTDVRWGEQLTLAIAVLRLHGITSCLVLLR